MSWDICEMFPNICQPINKESRQKIDEINGKLNVSQISNGETTHTFKCENEYNYIFCKHVWRDY